MAISAAVRRSLDLLSIRDRRLLWVVAGAQILLSFLDLAGVLLLGLVGALAVTVVASQPIPDVIETWAARLGMSALSPTQLLVAFALLAATFLASKSGISAYLSWRTLRFLANRQAIVSGAMTQLLLAQPLLFVQRRTGTETSYALTTGVTAATMGLLSQSLVIVSESALLIVLSVAILALDPLTALLSIGFFSVVGLLLYWGTAGRVHRQSSASATADIDSYTAVQESIGAYREIFVTNRRNYYVDRIVELRWLSARLYASMQFAGTFPKYLFEVALVLGGLGLTAILLTTRPAAEAIGLLSLYLIAASRVMPSLLRLQGAATSLRATAGAADPTFRLSDELAEATSVSAARSSIRRGSDEIHTRLAPAIVFDGVDFQYPGEGFPLRDLTFHLEAGQFVAVVGPSGSGKSTLADLLLGILEPSRGKVLVAGEEPRHIIADDPDYMGYVPQSTFIANASIRENVALGIDPASISDSRIWEALEISHLTAFVESLPHGLDTRLGEDSMRLSGGQRQRVGIARAVLNRPRLLVLDEATSALDTATEAEVSDAILAMGHTVTRIVIAHRLSTVASADTVLRLEAGRLVGISRAS